MSFIDTAAAPGMQRHVAHGYAVLVQALLDWRQEARRAQDYDIADRIVSMLAEAGVKTTSTGAQNGPLFWDVK